MPSRAKVIEVEEQENGYIVVVKVRGPGTKNFNSPVAKRAKFAAAREVNILNDYVPGTLRDIDVGENINEMMEGEWMGEIGSMQTLKGGIEQTVLYGVRLEK